MHDIVHLGAELSGRRNRIHRRDRDGAAGVDLDVHLVPGLEMGELEQGGVEDDAVRIADLGDRS